jgi:hypothetical protein
MFVLRCQFPPQVTVDLPYVFESVLHCGVWPGVRFLASGSVPEDPGLITNIFRIINRKGSEYQALPDLTHPLRELDCDSTRQSNAQSRFAKPEHVAGGQSKYSEKSSNCGF